METIDTSWTWDELYAEIEQLRERYDFQVDANRSLVEATAKSEAENERLRADVKYQSDWAHRWRMDLIDMEKKLAAAREAIHANNAVWEERIAAERERCARVAENYRSDNPYPTIYAAIAAAIRKGE